MSIPRIPSYTPPSVENLTANRVRWSVDPRRAVLLIHDMQDYFLDYYERDAAPVPQLIAQIERLRRAARRKGIPVVYTAQPAEQSPTQRGLLNDLWGPGLTALPERAAIAAPLAPEEGDTVLVKWRYSAFQRSALEQRMGEWRRDQLIVCGIYAHIGLLTTALDAFMRDIQPFLVADACADFSAERHAMALEYVATRCGAVTTSEAVLQRFGAPAADHGWSLDTLRASVSELLQLPPGELRDDDDLLDWGLDSIRLITLVNRWQGQGVPVDLAELAESMTLAAWWELLGARAPAAEGARVAG